MRVSGNPSCLSSVLSGVFIPPAVCASVASIYSNLDGDSSTLKNDYQMFASVYFDESRKIVL